MKQQFEDFKFKPQTLETIEIADSIIEEYEGQGFTLTCRQLYYQFVARGLLENTERSYKNLLTAVNKGRLAGLLDWESIEDRTRNLERNSHFRNPVDGLQALRNSYGLDMWTNQDHRVEVWIEKEALVGVIEDICTELDVPFFACRGYVSQSEQYRAGQRIRERYLIGGQKTVILHLGDHDPSGIDMTRDNDDRVWMFTEWLDDVVSVDRIALNMDQVQEYSPPPNPAKFKDSRFRAYVAEYGRSSWELDALEPTVIVGLIREHVDRWRDQDRWQERVDQYDSDIETIEAFIEDAS